MKIKLKPGKYVVAVSGGVDSMILLDLLSKHKNIEVTAAHINENLRNDSKDVQEMVRQTAKEYGLRFFTTNLKLKSAAEALGREARYRFLNQIADKMKADAIVTAHHQDDLLET